MERSSQRARLRRHLKLVTGETPARRPLEAWKWLLAGGGLGVFLLGIALVYWKPATEPEDVFQLTTGTIEVVHEAKALVIRRESVHISPAAGTLHRLVEDGQRIRVGTPVAEIRPGPPPAASPGRGTPAVPGGPPDVPGTSGGEHEGAAQMREELAALSAQVFGLAKQLQDAQARDDVAEVERLQARMDELASMQDELATALTAFERGETPYVPAPPPVIDEVAAEGAVVRSEAAGIVVFSLDGLEQVATPGSLASLTPGFVQDLQPTRRTVAEGAVSAGQALFKVIDNISMHMAVVLPREKAAGLAEGSRIEARLKEYGDRPLALRIEGLTVEGESALLVMVPDSFPDELTTVRLPAIKVILGRHQGLIAPVSAVDWSGPKPGIHVKEGRTTFFQPIQVIAQNETHVAFSANVPEGALVLVTAPAGQR